jgi:hypothetical protein
MSDWFNELKTSVEKGIQSGMESASKVLSDAFVDGFQNLLKLFELPEPAEPFRLIRVFRPTIEQPISRSGISIKGDSWKIEPCNDKNIILFQISRPSISECLFLCTANVKGKNLNKASLSLSNNTFKRSYSLQGTTDWHTCQVPFHYQQAKSPGDITIGIEFEGGGIFWLKDIQVFQAAVKPSVKTEIG